MEHHQTKPRISGLLLTQKRCYLSLRSTPCRWFKLEAANASQRNDVSQKGANYVEQGRYPKCIRVLLPRGAQWPVAKTAEGTHRSAHRTLRCHSAVSDPVTIQLSVAEFRSLPCGLAHVSTVLTRAHRPSANRPYRHPQDSRQVDIPNIVQKCCQDMH